ncbi:MAG: ATP-binding cassette domain-containing protein [Planctomycetaceae bacterium]|jgi:ABC-type oligopeptide transport system ATPase subunit|nr:ABC transporter ATP-binding protein [Phycisphaerales bacterium]MCE2654317.1 ATP-binding cassette domain-containing protein [Planctomycetaceae bacterium]
MLTASLCPTPRLSPDHPAAASSAGPTTSPTPPGGAAPASRPAASAPNGQKPLLSVTNLQTHFPIRTGLLQRTTGYVKAVDGITFHIAPGECLGLVGESGCGKTTVGRTLLRLIPATGGQVSFDGTDVYAASGRELQSLRRQMQIIFQDPAGSLNPRMRIASIIGEPLTVHSLVTEKDQLRTEVENILERCGMPRAAADRYPHEFSGGQRQRIGIARALALRPRFIVCDEPTSALDVSIQAQILNLLSDLQRDMKLSYLFISHDMAVIQHMCNRIAVMYKGKIVEEGTRDQVIGSPQHKYTQALLSAVPEPDPRRKRQRVVFEGMAT